MSSYLLVLYMERSSYWIEAKVQQGAWKAIKASRRGPHVTYLIFVDDILLFAEASKEKSILIKELQEFCDASGKKVKFCKFIAFFSPNVTNENATTLSQQGGVSSTPDRGRYLSFNMLHMGRNTMTYKELLMKARTKLAGWKSKCLSKAGHITVASTVLNTMSVFTLQLAKLPFEVHKGLDKVCRQCIWVKIM